MTTESRMESSANRGDPKLALPRGLMQFEEEPGAPVQLPDSTEH